MPTRTFLTLALVAASGSVYAGAPPEPYSDAHMSRSMQLIQMERAYDLGRRRGEHLTRDQVVALEAANLDLQQNVDVLNQRVDEVAAADRAAVKQAEAIAAEYNKLLDQRKELDLRIARMGAQLQDYDRTLSLMDKRMTQMGAVDEQIAFTAQSVLDSANAVGSERTALAEQQAAERVRDAQQEAEKILDAARMAAYDEQTDYERVMNERVSCSFLAPATISQVVACLTPPGWQSDIQIESEQLKGAVMTFVSDRPRALAARDFVEMVRAQTNPPVRLRISWHPRLSDAKGLPIPLMLVAEELNQ